ncbi:MAG TPA: hypothetical protein VD997_09105 [Phycisphaerales bacterium]|nr:hypothetical protein [Phycisphaerales bacterium]
MNKLGVLAALTLAPALLVGCDVYEKQTYTSTAAVPQTVSLRDVGTNEQLWSYDIPPGQQLKLWFSNSKSRANDLGYDEMVWTVGPIGQSSGPQNNRMRVPPPMSRRLEGSVRPAELGTKAAPAPELTSPAMK